MGLSPPRWWYELKGGRAERRQQVENQRKTRLAGRQEEGNGGERRREVFLIDKFHSSIANKIVRNYCDYGKLIYGHIERGIAFTIPRVKNSPTSRKRAACLDMTFTFATEFDVITSWDL